mgnify:CR=1 FL=1
MRCAYCQSQLALPEHGRPARIISQIDINVSPHVTATATKWLWILVLVPVLIVIIVIGAVFGALAPLMRSVGVSRPSRPRRRSARSQEIQRTVSPTKCCRLAARALVPA